MLNVYYSVVFDSHQILEKSIKLLFSTMNVSLVKAYVQRQCSKILSDRVSIQNLTFAREYRGMSGYRPTASVPALELARLHMYLFLLHRLIVCLFSCYRRSVAIDRRSEPRVGDRVPYVIVYGSPGLPLIQLACRWDHYLTYMYVHVCALLFSNVVRREYLHWMGWVSLTNIIL